MADISKISPDAGTTEYNVKDATARSDIASIVEKIPVNASSSNKFATEADIASAYHAAGTKTVAELLSSLLVAANEGNVYNMTDAGTTTADFIEGAGKPIRIGDNVGVCKVGNDYKFDLLSGFIDTSNFVKKSSTSGLLKNDGTVDTTSYVEAETGKGLSTNDYDATAKGIVDSIPLTVSQLQGSLLEKFPRAEQRVLGAKNLIPFPYYDKTKTTNGITFTVNNDGTVTANGTASASSYFECVWWTGVDSFPYKNTELILTGCPSGGSESTYKLDIGEAYNNPSWLKDYGEGVTIPYNHFNNNTNMIQIRIVIFSGQTVSNLTFKPMIRLASDTDDTYTPYAMTNRELTDELTVKESEVTDIVSGTIGNMGNHLYKYGKVVQFVLRLDNTTLPEWGSTPIFKIPQGYRPKSAIRCLDFFDTTRNININTDGTVFCSKAITNGTVTFNATWITS